MNAIAESRKAFIECEANEKLRRAIKSKLRPTTSLIYELGDEVYYKRNDSNQWKGPGTVLGKENKQVIVKHGGQHIRVHPCRLQSRNKYQSIDPILDDSNGNNLCKESTQKDVNKFYDDNVNEKEDIAIKNTRIENISELNSSMLNDDINKLTNSISSLPLNIDENESEDDVIESNQIEGNDYSNPIKTSKVNTKVIYHNPDTNSWNEALILGKAGKSTGKNKASLNIKNLHDNSHRSVDFSKIEGWKNIEEEVLITKHSDKNVDILKAKSVELENWKMHKVYEEVENKGQSFISVRWVITQKYKGECIYYKA